MMHDRYVVFFFFFFHVGLFFAILLPPLTAQKIKIQKNIKKSMEVPSFYTGAPKIMIIYYTVPETGCMTNVIIIIHFGQFFPVYPPNSPTIFFFKMTKIPRDIIILHKCTKNHDHML